MPVPFPASSRVDFVAVGRETVDMKAMPLTVPVGPSCALNPKCLPQRNVCAVIVFPSIRLGIRKPLTS